MMRSELLRPRLITSFGTYIGPFIIRTLIVIIAFHVCQILVDPKLVLVVSMAAPVAVVIVISRLVLVLYCTRECLRDPSWSPWGGPVGAKGVPFERFLAPLGAAGDPN